MAKARAILLLVAVFSVLTTLGAMADDWVAVKLRGGVFVFVDNDWVQLKRGDIVPDDRVVRTQPSGRVTFVRDQETIDVGPSSQIQIFDQNGKRFTTVRQFYGHVEVEAEVQNVQHFGVRTPYLAAVVKGTKFIVDSDDHSSSVKVMRGKVAVEDFESGKSVLLKAGQSIDSDNFVNTGFGGIPGGGVPKGVFADLGGGDPTVLKHLFGGGTGTGGGINLDLGDLGGVDLRLGGGQGLDLGAGVGGVVTLDLSAGGGSGVNLGVGVGGGGTGPGVGVSVGGGNGVTVATPLGGITLPLGGLL